MIKRASPSRPDFSIEDALEGPVCGLDEAGRGPLAGPVVAACVVVPPGKRSLEFIALINDSKKLSHARRDELYERITESFVFGIAEVSPQQIDQINILQASLLAMKLAYEKIDGARYALIDGNRRPALTCSMQTVVKGDSKSVSIAAASILAKVTRDRLMKKLAEEHPAYGWHSNAGYPTQSHLEAIDRHGITPHHRRSFAPVRNFLEFGVTQAPLEFPVKKTAVNH